MTTNEIWKVNGVTLNSCDEALNYCIKNKYAITEEETFFHRTTKVHLWNVTKIK